MDALALSEASAQAVGERDDQVNKPPEDTSLDQGENKFQKAISAWRSTCYQSNPLYCANLTPSDIDLSSLMPQLDSTASELVAHQRDALLERKEVAQKTKDFRKLEDAAKLSEYKSLLKCQSLALYFLRASKS